MKSIPLLVLAAFLAAPLGAQDDFGLPAWTNTAGITIHGEFLRLEGQAVVIRKDDKEFKIPFSRLNGDSIRQAEKLAATVRPAKPGEPPPVSDLPPAKSFGKQTDPEHQRKLAESILAKKGTVEIWRGSGSLVVARPEDLPKGVVSLKTVNATGAPFSDEDAALLNGCDKLTRLDIHRASLEGLPLESLTGLEWFQLFDARIEPSALRGLAGHKKLGEFHLHGVPVDRETLDVISSCQSVRVLVLNRADLKGHSLLPLARLKLLHNLQISGNGLGDADLAALARFSSLENLNLGDTNFSGESLGFLPSLKTVRGLELAGATLPEGAMAKVAAMPALSHLQLYNSKVAGKELHALAASKSLTELHLENTAVLAEDFSGMTPMPSLRRLTLNISKPTVSDSGARMLAATFPRLEAFVGNGSELSTAGIATLAGIGSLSELYLDDASDLDESSLGAIANMKRLSRLGLNRSGLKDEHVAALLEPLKSRLELLNIENTRLSDKAVESLSKLKSLRTLNIIGTDISAEGIASLKASLRGCEVRY